MSTDEQTTTQIKDINKRLRSGIADMITAAPGADTEAKIHQQMDILDMIFRRMVGNGALHNSESSYLAALKAQAQYRQMVGALNRLKNHKTDKPAPKNPWRTNY